jgi:hypothetical protein
MLGVVRSFPNFAAALAEINNARVYGGIHFRTAVDDGQATGMVVARFVLKNAFQRVDGNGGDDWRMKTTGLDDPHSSLEVGVQQ